MEEGSVCGSNGHRVICSRWESLKKFGRIKVGKKGINQRILSEKRRMKREGAGDRRSRKLLMRSDWVIYIVWVEILCHECTPICSMK